MAAAEQANERITQVAATHFERNGRDQNPNCNTIRGNASTLIVQHRESTQDVNYNARLTGTF